MGRQDTQSRAMETNNQTAQIPNIEVTQPPNFGAFDTSLMGVAIALLWAWRKLPDQFSDFLEAQTQLVKEGLHAIEKRLDKLEDRLDRQERGD